MQTTILPAKEFARRGRRVRTLSVHDREGRDRAKDAPRRYFSEILLLGKAKNLEPCQAKAFLRTNRKTAYSCCLHLLLRIQQIDQYLAAERTRQAAMCACAEDLDLACHRIYFLSQFLKGPIRSYATGPRGFLRDPATKPSARRTEERDRTSVCFQPLRSGCKDASRRRRWTECLEPLAHRSYLLSRYCSESDDSPITRSRRYHCDALLCEQQLDFGVRLCHYGDQQIQHGYGYQHLKPKKENKLEP